MAIEQMGFVKPPKPRTFRAICPDCTMILHYNWDDVRNHAEGLWWQALGKLTITCTNCKNEIIV